ncbi:hypothetical protein [Streptomyces rubrogriseus]|uniref:Uncharacterized protein n=1 Tax=Streptomyces rubrogriseus TaxID=194673 RepID=A0A6G3TPY7_9ACTN|nr:hypothetical protein [Streptomyces rubrogriseus]NEC38809.1 hypothetical protein [Streptomyces rubrogriseus]
MGKMTIRRLLIVVVAAAVVAVGAGLAVWATAFRSDAKELRASEMCNEGVFSAKVEPLERLVSPDSSFTSDWSREASDSSLLLTCSTSTSHASVKMTAELSEGSVSVDSGFCQRLGGGGERH